MMMRYEKYQKELINSSEHLRSLRHDISNNLLPDSLVLKYMSDEKRILFSLTQKAEQSVQILKDKKVYFYEIKDQAEAIRDSLMNGSDTLSLRL